MFLRSSTPITDLSEFPFKSCPSVIKDLILDSVDYLENQKFFNTNKELRNHVLRNGPYPRKVEKVMVRLSDRHCHQKTAAYLVEITTKDLEFEVYLSDEPFKELYGGQANLMNYAFIGKLKDFNVVNLIKTCKTVLINFQHFESIFTSNSRHVQLKQKPIETLFKEIKLLSNVKTVGNFDLNSPPGWAQIVLENFKPIITNITNLNIDRVEEEHRLYFSQLLQEPQFLQCKIFVTKEIEKDWKVYMKTNAEVILAICKSNNEIEKALRKLIDRGIPSGNETSAAAILADNASKRQELNQFLNISAKVLLGHSDIEEIAENSEEAKFLIEYFAEFDERFGKRGHSSFEPRPKLQLFYHQKRFFKETISDSKYSVYMIGIGNDKDGDDHGIDGDGNDGCSDGRSATQVGSIRTVPINGELSLLAGMHCPNRVHFVSHPKDDRLIKQMRKGKSFCRWNCVKVLGAEKHVSVTFCRIHEKAVSQGRGCIEIPECRGLASIHLPCELCAKKVECFLNTMDEECDKTVLATMKELQAESKGGCCLLEQNTCMLKVNGDRHCGKKGIAMLAFLFQEYFVKGVVVDDECDKTIVTALKELDARYKGMVKRLKKTLEKSFVINAMFC